MILYNITVKIELESAGDWLAWMRSTHIPQVLAAGGFLSCRMARVDNDDTDGLTYAVQYECESQRQLDDYLQHHAPRLRAEHSEQFADKFVAFRTVLHVLYTIENA